MKNNYELLAPLFNAVQAVENLIKENNALKKENEYLKERLKWFDETLNENAKLAGESIHEIISACVNGRITVNDNETIIKRE